MYWTYNEGTDPMKEQLTHEQVMASGRKMILDQLVSQSTKNELGHDQPNQPNRFTLLKLHHPIVIAGKTESIFDMRDVPAGYCISLHLERQIVQVSRLSNDGKKRHTVVVPLSDVAQLSYETDLRTDAERAAQP
jgi:hypothetical protein